ncbi:MAG: hypothetical protein Q8P41_05845 [Pseudomonadota bacterium]|nr:hypothetical protein [Pseudomonadota bacterium]
MLYGPLALLALLQGSPAAVAADSWVPTCPTKDDPSVWFVLAASPDAPPLPDFDCKGLFFDSTVACTQTVGLGKIRPASASPGGIPLLELRYLPYGDIGGIMGFFSRLDGGVLYKVPTVEATSYAATPPPATAEDLLELYLNQRNKASAATNNVTLHVWSCPDAKFHAPVGAIDPYGMKLVEHLGKISMY